MPGQGEVRQPPIVISRGYKVLSLLTVVATFALVVLGGMVRVTGSGLGCPDWPLCHGRLIPPINVPTLIEYSHRLVASMVSALVVALAIIAWRSYGKERWLVVPATTGVILLVWQVLLGGITVLMELPPAIILAHLATAQALLASMVIVFVVAQFRYRTSRLGDFPPSSGGSFPRLALVTLLLTYVLLLSGSYVTVSGAWAACTEWPLCQSSLLPREPLPLLHMAHRYLALPVLALGLALAHLAWRDRSHSPGLVSASFWMLGLVAAQVLVGALNIWLGFPPQTKSLHLALATGVWVFVVILAVLANMISRPAPEHRGIEPEAGTGLKRVAM